MKEYFCSVFGGYKNKKNGLRNLLTFIETTMSIPWDLNCTYIFADADPTTNYKTLHPEFSQISEPIRLLSTYSMTVWMLSFGIGCLLKENTDSV